MYALAQKYGFNLKMQRFTGLSIAQNLNGNLVKSEFREDHRSKEERVEFMKFLVELNDLVSSCDLENPAARVGAQELDSIISKDFSKMYPPVAQSILTELAQAFLGVEPEEMSALFFLDSVKSGTGLKNMGI